MVLGRYKGEFVTFDAPGHALVIGATRSGKSSGVLIPTLLQADTPQSFVINDPKLELWRCTGGYRATHGRALLLAPTLPTSQRFNPCRPFRGARQRNIASVDLLAEILVMPDGDIVDETGSHFAELSKRAPRGLLCYGQESGRCVTLGQLYTLVTSVPVNTLARDMQGGTHPLVQEAVALLADLADKEKSGVVSTARRVLSLYGDPYVARCVSAQ